MRLFPLRILVFSMIVAATALIDKTVEAQLFGPRLTGRTIQRPSSFGARSNLPSRLRRPTGFVGGDRRTNSDFVGSQPNVQTQNVRSAATGIRSGGNRGASVNSPLKQTAKDQMYLPRLAMEVPELSYRMDAREVQELTEFQLRSSISLDITVSVVDRKAVLRGVVDSAKSRRMAAILASFEPGVSVVQNDLKVDDDTTPRPPDPQPPVGS